jgi:dolichol-phosphate mannosyltransferase
MKIAVVIPCYKVTRHVLDVIKRMPAMVDRIYVVDDCCPEHSGDFVVANCPDPRVTVLRNPVNLGVGGAVLHGYRQALLDNMDIAVKIDGDGQMAPELLPRFVRPIVNGQADYTKGTRFFSYGMVREMPKLRLLGNAGLSFVSKIASGYWSLMDPTNGYTAIHTSALKLLPLDIIERRFFFESDMLYHLGIIRAVAADVPMFALYGDEVSNLSIVTTLRQFPSRYLTRFFKRFFYCYLLRDFNIGSIATLLAIPLITFGSIFGGAHWVAGLISGKANAAGTVIVAALPVIVGVQLLIAAALFDVSNQPKVPLQQVMSE